MRRQDLLLSVLHCLGFARVRNRILGRSERPITRFILFHDVPDNARANFERNLSYLRRFTNVVDLKDFLEGRLSTKQLNVVITFDDGYRSWIKTAVPVLKALKLPATFFVSSGFVGLSTADQSAYAKTQLRLSPASSSHVAGLSVAELRCLAEAGFTIGGHTVSHADLSATSDIGHLTREVVEDKKRLEGIVGKSIEFFAYPFGFCNNQVHSLPAILIEAGYRAAATTAPGFNNAASDRYFLHRELVGAGMPGLVFRARVHGNTDGVQWLRSRFSRLFGSSRRALPPHAA